MARPSLYKTQVKDKLILIEGWARDGLTDEQIAHNLGIANSTFYEYKNKYMEFAEALKKGKEIIDRHVENALLKRALGYEYNEIKREIDADGSIKQTITTKQVVPDTTAQIFWLKNRKPAEWRDRQQLEHTGADGGPIEIAELSEEEKKAFIKKVADRYVKE